MYGFFPLKAFTISGHKWIYREFSSISAGKVQLKIGFYEITPRCLPRCQSKFLLGVYFLTCSLFLNERLTKQKGTITATDQLSCETVHLCPLKYTVIVFFGTKFILSFQFLFSFLFVFFAMTVFTWGVFSLFCRRSRPFPLVCHDLCSCRELLLMMHVWFLWACLSLLLLWSDTSAPAVRRAEEEDVQMWMCGRWQGPQIVWGQFTRFMHIKFSSELSIEAGL